MAKQIDPSKSKKNKNSRLIMIMANLPVIWAGLLVGIACAYHFNSIDVMPMFTLAAFLFYTCVVVIWFVLGFVKHLRFFKSLAQILVIYEGIFLLCVYAINLIVDAHLFVYGTY